MIEQPPLPESNRLVSLRATYVVLTATVLFVVFFGVSNWMRQVNLVTSQYDMGNMDQVLWHTIHGQIFQMADPATGALLSRAAFHADYLLLIYTPFYALWSDPRLLLVLQVLAVASGVWPLFWIARRRLGDTIAALVAVAYLLFPTLQWAVIFDIHAVVLVTPLLLWAWWAMERKRWWAYGACAILAILGKEEIGLVIAAIGVYWVWRRGYRRMATASIVVGLAWTVIALGFIIPDARTDTAHFALNYYASYGSSYSSIIRHIIMNPGQVFGAIFGSGSWTLFWRLFLPGGFLAIAGLPVLLIVITEFGINLLSNDPAQHMIYYQYMSAITPIIFLAVVTGWSRIELWWARWWPKSSAVLWRKIMIVGMTVTVVMSAWLWSPLPGTAHSADALKVFKTSPYRNDVKKVQALLKSTDRVATTNTLAPQFSRRDMIWSFPDNLDQADVVVLLLGGEHEVLVDSAMREKTTALEQNASFVLVLHDRDFYFFRRVAVEQ